MIKIERSFPAPASLEAEAKKVSGSYETARCCISVEKRFSQ